jgi:hypothetical protein
MQKAKCKSEKRVPVAQTSAFEVCGSSLDSRSKHEVWRSSLRFVAFATEEPRTPKTGVRATPKPAVRNTR